jgi:hypothetical protein
MLVRSSFDHLVYTPVRGFHAAASVANLILTTAVIVTQLPEDKPAQGAVTTTAAVSAVAPSSDRGGPGVPVRARCAATSCGPCA